MKKNKEVEKVNFEIKEGKKQSVISFNDTDILSVNNEIADAIVLGPMLTLKNPEVNYDTSIINDYNMIREGGNADLEVVNKIGDLYYYVEGRRSTLIAMYSSYKLYLVNSILMHLLNNITKYGIYLDVCEARTVLLACFPDDPRAYMNEDLYESSFDLHMINHIIPMTCLDISNMIRTQTNLYNIRQLGEDNNEYYEEGYKDRLDFATKMTVFEAIINQISKGLHCSLVNAHDSLKNYVMNMLVETGYSNIKLVKDDDELNKALEENPDAIAITEF